MKIPPYLKKGDSIGLICPAGFMDADRTLVCIDTLKEWGYQVKVGKTIGGSSDNYFSATDDERLAELQEMMDDKTINAILCARGGYGTGRIIDRINFKKFRKNPKWIIGYSDITILHAHLNSQLKIASMHAPMAAAFNDGGATNQFVQSLKYAMAGKKAKYEADSHEYNITGKATGELIGGNLAILAHLVGTMSDIKTDNKILFIEDIGEYIYSTDRDLYQLKRAGKLDKLAGLIIGKFTDVKDTTRCFGKTVYEAIHDIIGEYDYPVCFGFPVSHGDENYALKVGVEYQLKVTPQKVTLTESFR